MGAGRGWGCPGKWLQSGFGDKQLQINFGLQQVFNNINDNFQTGGWNRQPWYLGAEGSGNRELLQQG